MHSPVTAAADAMNRFACMCINTNKRITTSGMAEQPDRKMMHDWR